MRRQCASLDESKCEILRRGVVIAKDGSTIACIWHGGENGVLKEGQEEGDEEKETEGSVARFGIMSA